MSFFFFLPKEKFSDFVLRKILDFLIKEKIEYTLISQENICKSLAGNFYTCKKINEIIKENKEFSFAFIPGGIGTLNLIEDNLIVAFLKANFSFEKIFFLEREAILFFYEIGLLYGRYVAKPINIEGKLNGCIEIEKDMVIDNNIITSSKLYNNKFFEIIKKTVKEKLT